jgi:hypothetical protein
MAEFELDGLRCLRFFHPETGTLCVLGPKESRKARRRYVQKYKTLCHSPDLRAFLSRIRPETAINAKLHAFLHLMEEHKDDIAEGMVITPDLFITVLDSFAPYKEFDPKAWH